MSAFSISLIHWSYVPKKFNTQIMINHHVAHIVCIGVLAQRDYT